MNYFVVTNRKTGESTSYATGSKFLFKKEFYERNIKENPNLYKYKYGTISPSTFNWVWFENGKPKWYFGNCVVDDFDWDRDVEKVVKHVPYVPPKTEKEIIKEKFENGTASKTIWAETVVWIVVMILLACFHERIWGWIAATIIYYFTCKEKLLK